MSRDLFLRDVTRGVQLRAIAMLKEELGEAAAVCGKVFGSWTQAYHYFGVEEFLIKTIYLRDDLQAGGKAPMKKTRCYVPWNHIDRWTKSNGGKTCLRTIQAHDTNAWFRPPSIWSKWRN